MSELAQLRDKVHELERELISLESTVQSELEARLVELQQARDQLSQETGDSESARQERVRLSQELESLRLALKDAERSAKENQERVDRSRAEIELLADERDEARTALKSVQKDNSDLRFQNQRLRVENTSLLKQQKDGVEESPPSSYPVRFDCNPPNEFGRGHALARFLLLGWLDLLLFALYPLPPLVSALMIFRKNGRRFRDEDAPLIMNALRAIVGVEAYLHLLSDQVYSAHSSGSVQFAVQPSGTPSVSFALMRLIYSLPTALVALLLWYVVFFTSFIAAVWVLAQKRYPPSLYNFHRGYVRWMARLCAYHFSIVEEHPPFSFDTGPESAGLASQPAS